MLFKKINVSIMLTLSLAACLTVKPFQPHPPIFTQWAKDGVSEEDVKESMRQCGYIDLYGYGGDKNATMNDRAKREKCMFRNGFRYKDGGQGLCELKNYKEVSACQSRK